MKKYNLSNIMKRAWEMVKKLGFGISEALKKAWKEAKEGETRMTGTEKQISFARDLVEKMNTQFDALIADCKAQFPENVSMWKSCKEGYNRIISMQDLQLICSKESTKHLIRNTIKNFSLMLSMDITQCATEF